MRKVATVNKALLLFTLLFVLIAAASFAVFRAPGSLCAGTQKCSGTTPVERTGGKMLWDDFSHRFLSFVPAR